MKRASIFAICLLLLTGCSKNVRDVRITANNKDTFIDEIKDMKGLTVDEVRLLIAFQALRGLDIKLGATSNDPSGKTVGELLDQLKKRGGVETLEAERQKRLADEAKANGEAVAAELRKTIALTVNDKGFVPSDPLSGRYTAQITFKCGYQNTSTRDIRAFQGKVQFVDLFGSEILTRPLSISDPIASGKKATWDGIIEYNQFLHPHQQLKSTELKDLKIVWIPELVIFADGSRLGAGQ